MDRITVRPSDKRFFEAGIVLAMLGLTLFRLSPTANGNILFVAKSLIHKTSLRGDLMVLAALQTPYTFVSACVARWAAWLFSTAGIAPEWSLAFLQILLWSVQGWIMLRLTETITGSRTAAALATLFYGMEIPLVLGDASFGTDMLDRSLCMAPFLWGFWAFIRGRRFEAVVCNALSMYLHATPAVYFWPAILLEDFISAWRNPELRKGAWLRLGAIFAMLAPLFLSVHRNSLNALPADYLRMNIVILGKELSGITYVPTDRLFIFEGFLLLALTLYQLRRLPAFPVLLRTIGLCLPMLLLGSIAYRMYVPGSVVWWIPLRAQLWASLALIDFIAEILLAALIVSGLERGAAGGAVLSFVLIHLSSVSHDFVLRALGIFLVAHIVWQHIKPVRRTAETAMAGVVLLSLGHWLFPQRIQALAHHAGFHGGVFNLPAFYPWMWAALLGCWAFGAWIRRADFRRYAGGYGSVAAPALVLFLFAAGEALGSSAPKEQSLIRMEAWIRENTLPEAVIMWSPLDLINPNDFMARSERATYGSFSYAVCAMKYGDLCGPQADRMRALGFDFSRIHDISDFVPEEQRVDAALDPARAETLKEKYGVTHLLLRAGRSWSGPMVHREGDLTLYLL